MTSTPTSDKRQRLSQESGQHFAVPDDVLLSIFAFSESDDVPNLMRVCRHWNSAMRGGRSADLWRGLIRTIHPALADAERIPASQQGEGSASGTENELSGGAWWRNLFFGRERIVRSYGRDAERLDCQDPTAIEDCDREYAATIDDVDEDSGVFIPAPLSAYTFNVSVWDSQATSHSVDENLNVEIYDGTINFAMGRRESVAILKDAKAIEVHVKLGNESALLYSGLNKKEDCSHSSSRDFEPYGGESFEKFASLSWFNSSLNYEPENGNHFRLLPFVSSTGFEAIDGCFDECSVRLQMTWRDSHDNTAEPMSMRDVLVFLQKGLSYEKMETPEFRHRAMPQHLSDRHDHTTSDGADLTSTLKSLTSYSIVLDFYRVTSGPDSQYETASLAASRYYKSTEFESDEAVLQGMNIQSCLESMVSPDGNVDSIIQDLNMVASIIDRQTGKQSKFCEGYFSDSEDGILYQGTNEFCAFKRSAAISFYCLRDENDSMPIPAGSAEIYSQGVSNEIQLSLWAMYWNAAGDNGGFRASLQRRGFLVFLENGLVYK